MHSHAHVQTERAYCVPAASLGKFVSTHTGRGDPVKWPVNQKGTVNKSEAIILSTTIRDSWQMSHFKYYICLTSVSCVSSNAL